MKTQTASRPSAGNSTTTQPRQSHSRRRHDRTLPLIIDDLTLGSIMPGDTLHRVQERCMELNQCPLHAVPAIIEAWLDSDPHAPAPSKALSAPQPETFEAFCAAHGAVLARVIEAGGNSQAILLNSRDGTYTAATASVLFRDSDQEWIGTGDYIEQYGAAAMLTVLGALPASSFKTLYDAEPMDRAEVCAWLEKHFPKNERPPEFKTAPSAKPVNRAANSNPVGAVYTLDSFTPHVSGIGGASIQTGALAMHIAQQLDLHAGLIIAACLAAPSDFANDLNKADVAEILAVSNEVVSMLKDGFQWSGGELFCLPGLGGLVELNPTGYLSSVAHALYWLLDSLVSPAMESLNTRLALAFVECLAVIEQIAHEYEGLATGRTIASPSKVQQAEARARWALHVQVAA